MIKFDAYNVDIERQKFSCIIVGIFKSQSLSLIGEKLDNISGGYISSLMKEGDMEGRFQQKLLLYHVPNILSERILLIGCGNEKEISARKYKEIIKEIILSLKNTTSTEVVFFLNELQVTGQNIYWKIRYLIEATQEVLYDFSQLKTKKIQSYSALRRIIFNVSNHDELSMSKNAIRHGIAITSGIKIAKDLGNMPPNLCNASYLASQAQQLAHNFNKNIFIDIIEEKKMQELGMHAYLAVGRGSYNESVMSVIKYKGDCSSNIPPIVLIGKGVTFDSGGISIKPSSYMGEMKYDMCGAAAVYGVMNVVSELQLPINVIGILAGCENMPGGKSYRPGDIITTMSGKTVEIVDTDAEGRLVLCDVLTYVERFNPDIVIDVATLTGACVIALGNHITAIMSNYKPLIEELTFASEKSGDYIWNLPLYEEFQEQIESNFADLMNVGGRSGSVITAGCFLSRFTSKYKWAHLDIAGTAYCTEKNRNTSYISTGRPVALLSQFLLNRSGLNIE